MGEIKIAHPVKLIIGEIFHNEELASLAERELVKTLGDIDLASKTVPFDLTDYYSGEMGNNLSRRWVSFDRLIQPNSLAEIKNLTNKIEAHIAGGNKRVVNIDPGYIAAPNLVLASTKNFAHRIYLSKGIYAELALIYRNNGFDSLPWTYPDYKLNDALDFFKRVRDIYLISLKLIK